MIHMGDVISTVGVYYQYHGGYLEYHNLNMKTKYTYVYINVALNCRKMITVIIPIRINVRAEDTHITGSSHIKSCSYTANFLRESLKALAVSPFSNCILLLSNVPIWILHLSFAPGVDEKWGTSYF